MPTKTAEWKPPAGFWIALLFMCASSCCGYMVGFDDGQLPPGGNIKPWSKHGSAVMRKLEGH